MLERREVIPERELTPGGELLAEGRRLAQTWRVGPSAFLAAVSEPSEFAYKRRQMAAGRVMQHGQVGFRDPVKSRRACAEIHEACTAEGVTVDRYGLCLDWSMGYPPDLRDKRPKGTGMILRGPEDFAALSAAAPVAPHFGDFVLGFPAAFENTQAALAAGSTSIGNLGQFFTFRLPHWDDDAALTAATVTALGLIAGQEVEVMVHSNLDDGFAALFTDLACCLGAALIEKHIVEELIGAPLAHCYGHHFSEPLTRLAFQRALARVSTTPGTMVYGNTVSYRGGAAANFASLGSYLLTDILAQRRLPSGHAVNPVPVTENRRIPDVEEIVEAQLFAARLIEAAPGHDALLDTAPADQLADQIVSGGEVFRDRVLAALQAGGFDTTDPFELLLALRRIGAKRLEELFGPGAEHPAVPRGRRPLVPATTIRELHEDAERRLARIAPGTREILGAARLSALVATTDVHEHGKLLVEEVLKGLGVAVLDGGISTDPDDLARRARETGADLIALSTYNGVALSYFEELKAELARQGLETPILLGGRLNQVPAQSNTSLPVEVTAELAAAGAVVCHEVEDAVTTLLALAEAARVVENQSG
ncbi:MAG: cobalamin-dependent protein [Rhodospirillales bacterium]|nr:cobalamin-dependent protein [Rhodospirillales bacterium]